MTVRLPFYQTGVKDKSDDERVRDERRRVDDEIDVEAWIRLTSLMND